MPEDQMYRIIGGAFRKRAAAMAAATGSSESLEDEYLINSQEEEVGTAFEWPTSTGTSSLPIVCFISTGKPKEGQAARFVMPMDTLLVAGYSQAGALLDLSQAVLEVNRMSANLRCINWKELPKPSDLLTATLFSSIKSDPSTTGALTRLVDVTQSQPATLESHLLYLLTASSLPYANALASRIQQISEALKEDEDERLTLAPQSIGHLISFLESNPRVAKPMLATSPLGHVMAKWIWNNGKMSIHFFPDGKAHCIISTPNPLHAEKQDQDSSVTTADALGIKLERQGALRLIQT